MSAQETDMPRNTSYMKVLYKHDEHVLNVRCPNGGKQWMGIFPVSQDGLWHRNDPNCLLCGFDLAIESWELVATPGSYVAEHAPSTPTIETTGHVPMLPVSIR